MLGEKPILQVALDFEHLYEAERIAKLLKQELNDVEFWCEAGTPLIKNEGLKKVIPKLREILGEKTKIVADLKTLDTGAFEVELAYKAGADIIGIAGASEKETIEAALNRAKKFQKLVPIMVDSIGVRNIESRLEWILKKINNHNKDSGFAILEYHIPIDRQDKTRDFRQIKNICEQSDVPVAAAGGLDEKTIPEVLNYGAKICVVGGAITRANNPKEAIKKIKKVIYRT